MSNEKNAWRRNKDLMFAVLCGAILAGLTLHVPHAMSARAGAIQEHYPAKHWEHASSPESLGWSSAKLALAKQYADSIDTAAVMIIDHGLIVNEWGNTAKKYNVHSIRKSFQIRRSRPDGQLLSGNNVLRHHN
jgi:hypothetical protein